MYSVRIAVAKLINRSQPLQAHRFDDSGDHTVWGDVLRVTNPEDVPLSSNHMTTVIICYHEGHDECRVLTTDSILVEEISCGQAGHSHQSAHLEEEPVDGAA